MSDFTIIGSGVGGLSAAYELVNKNNTVEIYEEGDYLDEKNTKKDISENLINYWRNSGFTPVFGKTNLVISEGMGVGGSTLINGGVIARPKKKIIKNWINEHNFEISDIEKLENVFNENEKLLNITNNYKYGNKDSELLVENAKKLNLETRKVDRAVINCKNHNRCAFGCTSNAKQSLDKVLLKKIPSSKLKIWTKHKLIKILNYKNKIDEIVLYDLEKKILIKKDKKSYFILRKYTNSNILLKNNIIDRAHDIQFHANIKILATYPFEINSEDSTILSHHVSEYENDGALIMTSNFIDSINAASLNNFNMYEINEFMKDRKKSTIYNVQVKLLSSGIKFKKIFNNIFNYWKLSDEDFKRILFYLEKLLNITFQSSPEKVYLPLKRSVILKNLNESKNLLKTIKPSDIFINSVHLMSSCSVSEKIKNNFIDKKGKIKKIENLFISDASILPTNIGQHPQNTIMAISREMIKKNF